MFLHLVFEGHGAPAGVTNGQGGNSKGRYPDMNPPQLAGGKKPKIFTVSVMVLKFSYGYEA